MAGWLDDAQRIDAMVYAAIARTDTPTLDVAMRRLSRTADYSKPWLATAAVLALAGGERGRRAAARGLISVGVAATLANLLAKPLSLRGRPQRGILEVPERRHVPMPRSSSFPSGHTASAFAFATGVARVQPSLSMPLRAAATLIGYSRVHTGVHYPGDVLAGAFLGVSSAELANRFFDHRRTR
ncbi:MAG: phosphatase PAP2 family protein [Solirubrobacterales bacterium]